MSPSFSQVLLHDHVLVRVTRAIRNSLEHQELVRRFLLIIARINNHVDLLGKTHHAIQTRDVALCSSIFNLRVLVTVLRFEEEQIQDHSLDKDIESKHRHVAIRSVNGSPRPANLG